MILHKQRLITLAALATLTLPLLGCESLYRRDAYTGEYEYSAQAIGGTLGLGAGLLTAAGIVAIVDPTHGAMVYLAAGTIGVIVGNIAGYFFDEHEQEIRNKLLVNGVQVKRQPNNELILEMPEPLFSLGSAKLEPTYYGSLDSLALVLKEFNNTIAVVVGYTDDIGSYRDNQVLSQQRADAVVNYLKQQNVPAWQLYAIGGGEAQRPFWETQADSRHDNRRVIIALVHAENQSLGLTRVDALKGTDTEYAAIDQY